MLFVAHPTAHFDVAGEFLDAVIGLSVMWTGRGPVGMQTANERHNSCLATTCTTPTASAGTAVASGVANAIAFTPGQMIFGDTGAAVGWGLAATTLLR